MSALTVVFFVASGDVTPLYRVLLLISALRSIGLRASIIATGLAWVSIHVLYSPIFCKVPCTFDDYYIIFSVKPTLWRSDTQASARRTRSIDMFAYRISVSPRHMLLLGINETKARHLVGTDEVDILQEWVVTRRRPLCQLM